jgi:NAD(P)-dependent dehydrogenase (short-subunit alcohol dehydrogenase family)
VALVTGAGRGLGRAVAAELGAAGAHLVVAARTRSSIERLVVEIEAAGGEALAVECDVRVAEQVAALLSKTIARFGGLDVLVNNAGVFQMAPIARTDEAAWDAMLDTNLKGAFLVTRAALPWLEARRGHVFNMVSSAGRDAYPDNGAYCASKWGLLGFTNVLREEMRQRGVRVTALIPGATDTPIWEGVPGTWDRSRMLRPEILARLVVEVCTQPPEASTDEIVLFPTGGVL